MPDRLFGLILEPAAAYDEVQVTGHLYSELHRSFSIVEEGLVCTRRWITYRKEKPCLMLTLLWGEARSIAKRGEA